jgi:hypothetical protein
MPLRPNSSIVEEPEGRLGHVQRQPKARVKPARHGPRPVARDLLESCLLESVAQSVRAAGDRAPPLGVQTAARFECGAGGFELTAVRIEENREIALARRGTADQSFRDHRDRIS